LEVFAEDFGSESSPREGVMLAVSWRVASWGLTITGFLGWVLAINAALSGEYGGAGICLAASGVAFGLVRFTMRSAK
jgi:hypothetical protein